MELRGGRGVGDSDVRLTPDPNSTYPEMWARILWRISQIWELKQDLVG